MKPVPSTLEGGTFDPRRRHLRPSEAAPSTLEGGTFLFVPWGGMLNWDIFATRMPYFGEHSNCVE